MGSYTVRGYVPSNQLYKSTSFMNVYIRLGQVCIPGYQLYLHIARIQLFKIDIAGYEERTRVLCMIQKWRAQSPANEHSGVFGWISTLYTKIR